MYLYFAADPSSLYDLYETGIHCGDDGYIHLQESLSDATLFGRLEKLSDLKLFFQTAVIRVEVDESTTETDTLPVVLGRQFKLTLPPGRRVSYDIPVANMIRMNELHSLIR
jgi:hypothetical protein